MYHKALDLQKHDQFEESAKAYHELLEARLLREVRRPRPLPSVPPSWLDDLGHIVSPVCPSASACSLWLCAGWVAVRVE